MSVSGGVRVWVRGFSFDCRIEFLREYECSLSANMNVDMRSYD